MNLELNGYLLKVNTKTDWDDVWSTVKARYDMWEASQGRKFFIGDSVSFTIETGRNRGHYSGIIDKLGVKAAKIIVHGIEWSMPYSYLSKV